MKRRRLSFYVPGVIWWRPAFEWSRVIVMKECGQWIPWYWFTGFEWLWFGVAYTVRGNRVKPPEPKRRIDKQL